MAAPRRPRALGGFTLLEVLVALAVLALGLAALIGAASSQARNSAYLVDRTLAQWVAANAVAGYRLERSWPELGDSGGEQEMAGRRWYWQVTTTATDDPQLRRLAVAVRRQRNDEQPVTTLIAYLAAPPGSEP